VAVATAGKRRHVQLDGLEPVVEILSKSTRYDCVSRAAQATHVSCMGKGQLRRIEGVPLHFDDRPRGYQRFLGEILLVLGFFRLPPSAAWNLLSRTEPFLPRNPRGHGEFPQCTYRFIRF
jgi:hypothetical protein